MNNYEFILNLKDVDYVIKFLELIFIIFITNYTFIKIINEISFKKEKLLIILIITPVISLCVIIIEKIVNLYYGWMFLVFCIIIENILLYKKDLIYTILSSIISFAISYVIYIVSVMICFFPAIIFKIQNDLIIYIIISYRVLNLKRIKYGLSFLQQKLEMSNISILILNIAAITLFSFIIVQSSNALGAGRVAISCIVLSITMFLTIKQSFDLYYKQNLLTKDLEETKKELEEKKQEIAKLEKENLEFSKTSHSLAHRQKALEYKLEQLMKTDLDSKSKENIKEEIENASKELFKEPKEVELAKTEIESIDNMLSFMQSECIKNNIKFELQVVGNIYYMINNLITENDLEILIADHIKDAIIAISNSDNLNRSILVRIGKIDNVYSLYIYDSGIEFTKEVLDNLGKKPITTHADTGGTGMGFMNTFDTLNKTKASLIINEIGKPCEDNYTKVLIFKFDNQNEFKVNSYKDEVVV